MSREGSMATASNQWLERGKCNGARAESHYPPVQNRSAESAEIERAEINARAAVDDPLRKGFANRRGVFETMTRARRRNDYSIRLRMSIDDEPEVGRHRVEAR